MDRDSDKWPEKTDSPLTTTGERERMLKERESGRAMGQVIGGGYRETDQAAMQAKEYIGGSAGEVRGLGRLRDGGPRLATLPERVLMAVERGDHEVARAQRARRALDLMQRNPEVAELVELLRDF